MMSVKDKRKKERREKARLDGKRNEARKGIMKK